MIIQILIFLLLILGNSFFIWKYLKLKKGLKEYSKIGTGRYGFYKYSDPKYSFYNAYVYVTEIDRYTDGYSKIKIDKIESLNKSYEDESLNRSRKDFLSLKLTKEIEWLESEDNIRRLRKEKLEKISQI